MLHRTAFMAAALALVSACQGSKPAGRATAPSVDASSNSTSREEQQRSLALVSSGGSSRTDREIAVLQSAARLRPTSVEPWLALARAWIDKARERSDPGFYLNADACAELALAIAPENLPALELRSLVLQNAHRFREARDVADSVVARDPGAALTRGALSDALLELGELEAAEREAQTMMELKPNLPAYSRVSYFQWLHGDEQSALESARRAIDASADQRHPEPRAWMLVQTAMLFWHRGDLEGADAGFQMALATLPDYAPALVGRGRVALAQREASRAASLLERAYEQSPLVETSWLLAEAKEASQDLAGARRARENAIREGELNDARTLSLMWSTRDERPADALRLAQRERSVRGDIYTDDTLAWALYRNGRLSEARRAIEQACRWGTRDARLLFHHGAILIALGERSAGQRLVRDALQQNPYFDARGAIEAKALLTAS